MPLWYSDFLKSFYIERMKLATVYEYVRVRMCLCSNDCIMCAHLHMTLIMFVCHHQINGQDVQDRQEAMAALSSDECKNIVLLVARPEMQVRNDHTLALKYCMFQPLNETPILGLPWVKEGCYLQITIHLLRINLSSRV